MYKIIGQNSYFYIYFIFTKSTKEQTSVVTPLAIISDLIGRSFSGELTCEMIDIFSQPSDHAAYHLDQVRGLI